MSHITKELPAFEAWFQAVWLGDEEHGQRIPTAISDPLYPQYLEHHQLALGAWMHRAALAQPEPVSLKWTLVEEWWESGNEDFDKLKEAVAQMLAAANGSQPEPVELTDEQILALNTGEVFFSESPSKYPECGHGTQYHAGAPGVVGFARAVLAAAKGGAL